MIPKIIHYCWFGPKAYSQTVRKCMVTWKRHLSDYRFCLWNEQTCANYAATHGVPNPMEHPFVQSAYRAKKYAFVADYVRFWALYYMGGVYLDTDMYVVRSFDALLDAEFFGGWETAEGSAQHSTDGIVSCGALGAANPRPLLLQHNEATIYPYDYFYPLPYQERYVWRKCKYNTPNTYAVHLWDVSWGKRQAKMRDWIVYVISRS